MDKKRLNEIGETFMSYGDNWTDRAILDLLEYILSLENEISRWLTKEELDVIKGRLQKATKGPWNADKQVDFNANVVKDMTLLVDFAEKILNSYIIKRPK